MKKNLIFSILIFGFPLLANEGQLAEAFKKFKTGSYSEAISTLKKVRGNQKLMGTRYYLQGLSYNRLQSYDLAITSFEKARKLKSRSRDLYYEYGQALYANNELEESRNIFKKSFTSSYKKASSLYYMAHISQLLEQHEVAKENYTKLIKLESKDLALIQVSQFQLAETLLALSEKDKEQEVIIKKYVLPLMKKATKTVPQAQIVGDINKRVKEIERQFGLDPNILKNGKVLSSKRWSLSLSQEVSYDNNITLTTDQPTSAATQKDSFIYYSSLNTSYKSSFFNRYLITPHFRFKNTAHSNREDSSVHTNDAYNITTGLKTSYEHTLFGQQASFILNWDYNYTARDKLLLKERSKFAHSNTITIGEKFRLFSFGKTSFKFKYKDYIGWKDSLNNKVKTFSIDQIKITPRGHLWIFFAQVDFVDNYNNKSSSSDSYLFRVDWLIPEFWPSYTLNLAMAYTMTDTKLQKLTRGTEKTYNPSIKLTKNVTRNLSAIVSYNYTVNTSLDKASYDYTKNVTAFEINYNF